MIRIHHVPRVTVRFALTLARRALRASWVHADAIVAASVYLAFMGVGLGSTL